MKNNANMAEAQKLNKSRRRKILARVKAELDAASHADWEITRGAEQVATIGPKGNVSVGYRPAAVLNLRLRMFRAGRKEPKR